ncbi:MAG: His Kinase (Phospho-acceptor) protein [Bacteroidetes bacterium]|nr:His Kinase (Phospho-acceptor) protein [Bacteroidota bacterium]
MTKKNTPNISDKDLAFQINENESLSEQLSIANKLIASEHLEKIKRSEELLVANKALAIQNKEKEKSAAELLIANKELAYQNKEKEARALELIIANKELAFQNKEKEKRVEELKIANIELVFQNKEKEKRAEELIIANEKLAVQNKEKIERSAQLEAANKELESFSYSVSHDLRAPIRAIHGYARMLKEFQNNPEDLESNRLMNNIINNAKRMARLIDDLLTFSRLSRKELIKVEVEMNDLVTNLCHELKNEQNDRNIQFHINPLLPAAGNVTSLKHVWANLISNAIKYTKYKDKSVIEISSEANGGEIIYSIKDNGAGFDMRYANKLFGVFQRLHSDDEFEGTGVGLAMVQRIINKHGGRVWAQGAVNEGATFFFALNKI